MLQTINKQCETLLKMLSELEARGVMSHMNFEFSQMVGTFTNFFFWGGKLFVCLCVCCE